MKKLISICLSITLILGLMPLMTVTAADTVTVSTTEPTLVEAEDHADCVKATKAGVEAAASTSIVDDAGSSGEKYLKASNYDRAKSERTLYWEYKFTVTQNGTYTVKTSVGKPWRYRFNSLSVTFGETSMANITAWGDTTTGDAVEWGEYTNDIALTAGTTYTFKVETGTGGNENHLMFVDYISVTPKELEQPDDGADDTTGTIEVSTTVPTLVEAEDHADCVKATKAGVEAAASTSIEDDAGSSGEKYLFASNYDGAQSERTLYWEYKFTITQNGTYTVKTSVGKPWRYRFNSLSVTFGETSMANITAWGDTTTGDAVEWGEYTNDIALTAGTTYSFKVETGVGTGGNHHLYVDYVSVTPKDLEQPDDGGESTIKVEVEDTTTIYRTINDETTEVNGTVVEEAGFSNEKYLKYDAQVQGGPTAVWKTTVNIQTEGKYDVSYRVRRNANWEGNLTLLIDDETVDEVPEGTQEWLTKTVTKTLSAGSHTIAISSHRGNVNSIIFADYIEITPNNTQEPDDGGGSDDDEPVIPTPTPESATVPVDIAGATIEAEDYPKTFVNNNGTVTEYDATVKTDIETASGGEYLFNNKGGSITGAEHYWEIKLDVPSTGIYEIVSTVPTLTRYRFNSVKVMIDDNELYSEESSWPSYNNEIPEFNNKTSQVFLEEGIHTYRFYAGTAGNGNQMLNFDAIKITLIKENHEAPVASNVEFSMTDAEWVGGKVSVTYSYSSDTNEGDSKLQIFYKDGEEWKLLDSVVTGEGKGSIEITESMANKEIKAVFFAQDKYAVKTELFEQALPTPRRPELYIGYTFNDGAEGYEADIQIDYFEEELDISGVLIILALYDETDAMVDFEEKHIGLSEKGVYTDTISKSHEHAAYAKIYAWSGTGVTSANETAYREEYRYPENN